MSVQPLVVGVSEAERVPAFPVHRHSGLTLSTHYFSSSILWSFVLIGLLLVWYAVEKYIFHLKGNPIRMVADPTEFAVRIVGLAHFIIAAMFLVTTPRLKTFSGWVWLIALAGISVLQCRGFAYMGGHKNPIMLIAFYMYFIIHAFRDEAFFYRVRAGAAVPPQEHTEVVLKWLQVIAICVLVALLTAVGTVYSQIGVVTENQTALQKIFPADWPFIAIFAMTVSPAAALATLAFMQIQVKQPGGFLGLCRTHTPLIKVIGFSVLIALSSMLIGAWTYNLIIVMHFVAWFEFTTVKIRKIPREVQRSVTWRTPMEWFKKNLAGFCVLHVGLSVFFLMLITTNHYVLHRAPVHVAGHAVSNPLELLFSASNLYYWTIAHVTLSFFPRAVPLTKPVV